MKIYTKKGDKGSTSLFRGGLVLKGSRRVSAYGSVDELNSIIGWIRSQELPDRLDRILDRVQRDLFIIGTDLATPERASKAEDRAQMRLAAGAETFMEEAIDDLEEELKPLDRFILPGGSTVAASIHIARSVCRRSERDAVNVMEDDHINPTVLIYLNRLSDMLFVMARYANHAAGVDDIPWNNHAES